MSIGHSLAFHFHGYNIRPFLETQLAPCSTRLTPYYKSFVGLSDTSNLAAVLNSVKSTTQRAAAPSPIATQIIQITHATSTTFASAAEAIEVSTPLSSHIVEDVTNSNGSSTLNNAIWLCLFLYILILLAFAAGLMAYGRPKKRSQPAIAAPVPGIPKLNPVESTPPLSEEKPTMLSKGQCTDDDETHRLQGKRIIELETVLEQATNTLGDRVIHLENVEKQLKGSIQSLQTQANAPSPPPQSQAAQESAWSKKKKKLEDENSILREGSKRKDATIQTQKTAHLEEKADWQGQLDSLQWNIVIYKKDAIKHGQLSEEHSELKIEYEKSEREVARLNEVLSTLQKTLKGQGTVYEERISSIEQARAKTHDQHKQELSRASQDAERDRLRANESEEKHEVLVDTHQQLQAVYNEKVTETTNLNSNIASLEHALSNTRIQVQARDTRITEQENIIIGFKDTTAGLMSLRENLQKVEKEHSHCDANLKRVGDHCFTLEDRVLELESIIAEPGILDDGSQRAESEGDAEDDTEEDAEELSDAFSDLGHDTSLTTKTAEVASYTTSESLSPMASHSVEQSQAQSTTTPQTIDAVVESDLEVEQPLIKRPSAPAFANVAATSPSRWKSKSPPPTSAPKGPKNHRKPVHQPIYPNLIGHAGNRYRSEDFSGDVPHSDASTASDQRTYEFDENGKRRSFNKFYKNYMAERGGGIQGFGGRGRGHSSSGRGGSRPDGQRGGRGTNRGGYRGRGRGD